MRLTAINVKTGRVLMTQLGTVPEVAFRQTVLANFPETDPKDILIASDADGDGTQAPSKRNRNVVWRGSYTDLGGYANMNREIVFRLATQHGFTVKIEVLPTGPQADSMTRNMLKALERTIIPNEHSCPMVIGFTPMAVRKAGRRVVFYTMMESQGVHPEFVKRCNESATEVWTPSRFYEQAFKKSGVVRSIHVIPLGVNARLYHPEAPEPKLRYEEMPTGRIVEEIPDGFRFMSLFGWSYRKGTDILCRSFLKEFNGSDNVGLVIHSRYMGSSAEPQKQYVRDEIRGYYREIAKENPARIYYCGDEIPISDLPGCYAAADCFVFCSRGEGFGLPNCEAAACGVPVISAFNTAMQEYLDDDVAYLVRPEGIAPANDRLTWISEYYRDQEFAVMGERSIAEFGKHMRHVYEDRKGSAAKASAFRKRVLEKYTWDVCADAVAARLLEG